LQLRRERAALFREAGYLPLAADGPAADHAVAYARMHENSAILVVAARLTWTLCRGDDGRWSPSLWQGTQLRGAGENAALRRIRVWRNWLTGDEVTAGSADDEGSFDLAAVFAGAGGLPFCVLVGDAEAA
jgi:(1->4)-alpha-D-glucan 1-alpha-D-glucosylmutase